MLLEPRYRFYSIGPFDDGGAMSFARDLQQRLDHEAERLGLRPEESPSVDIVDDRVWYARVFDVTSAETLMALLRDGVNDEGLTQDERWRRQGLLDDVTEWLQSEYDPLQDESSVSD
jgi:hypothetical protein